MSDEASIRRAGPGDAHIITEVVTLAFADDPVWGQILARLNDGSAGRESFWRILVDGALRYRWTWIAGEGEAVAIWIPPGGTELDDEQEARLDAFVDEHLASAASDFRELVRRFDAAHPRDEPHYYLSLLGTHPRHRGKGVGMRLLARTLEVMDKEHSPAYLESTNPANDRRYRSVGFEAVGEFRYPGDGPVITTMWRPGR